MATNFRDLLKKQENYGSIAENARTTKKNYKDDRFYSPVKDKDGNAHVLIRFLPPSKDDSIPFVKVFEHSVNIDNKYFIENCPKTIGEKCPCCDHYFASYKKEDDAWNLGYANKFKRKEKFIANILILNDPQTPENNGKVFLYKFGKQIMDKIIDATEKKFEGDEQIHAFSFVDGANFKLVQTMDGNWPDFTSSTFQSKSVLFGGDEDKLAAVWESEYALTEFTAPERFKSFEDLQKNLQKVISKSSGSADTTNDVVSEDVEKYATINSTNDGDYLPETTLDDITAAMRSIDIDELDSLESLLKK